MNVYQENFKNSFAELFRGLEQHKTVSYLNNKLQKFDFNTVLRFDTNKT